jgi:undecaprenyl-diphosphatase
MIGRLSTWEDAVMRRLVWLQRPPWGWLVAAGAHLGDSVVWVAVALIVLIWGTPALRRLTWWAILAVVAGQLIATAIKYSVRRPRPRERRGFYIVQYDRYSFPSGHSVRMAAIATIVAYVYPGLALVCYALALLVAACRVLSGVHYPTDVAVGLLIGLFSGAGVLYLFA